MRRAEAQGGRIVSRKSDRAAAETQRHEALQALRRALIVDAAKSVFSAQGLEGASMRAIATAAGCTTGAIYPHFDGKQELYAAVLAESLTALESSIARRQARQRHPLGTAQAGLRAFFDFYRTRPDELALGLYLYRGLRPAGLNPSLDKSLNHQLQGIFGRIEEAYRRAGIQDPAAKTAAGVAQAVGLLILQQTGRLALFGTKAPALFAAYLETG